MTTTFEEFAGQRAANYSTMPTKDVSILPDTRQCKTCHEEIVSTRPAGLPSWGPPKWVHLDKGVADHGYISPAVRCRFCRSHDAVYRQHAWCDATECPRCGGVDGFAIGD